MKSQSSNVPLVLGVGAGLGALYLLINTLIVSPYKEMSKQVPQLTKKLGDLKKNESELRQMRLKWSTLSGRTFAKPIARIEIDNALKELLRKHNLQHPSVVSTM